MDRSLGTGYDYRSWLLNIYEYHAGREGIEVFGFVLGARHKSWQEKSSLVASLEYRKPQTVYYLF